MTCKLIYYLHIEMLKEQQNMFNTEFMNWNRKSSYNLEKVTVH